MPVSSGIASTGARCRVLPWQRKICQKSGKRGKKSGKRGGKSGRGKIGKKRQQSGRFFHFAPPDRYGWLHYCLLCNLHTLWNNSSEFRIKCYSPLSSLVCLHLHSIALTCTILIFGTHHDGKKWEIWDVPPPPAPAREVTSDKLFIILVEIFVVPLNKWENALCSVSFCHFTPWTWLLQFAHFCPL